MDQIFKIKDAFVNYLSPVAKRRRTIGPQTPRYSAADDEHQFFSEPRNNKTTHNVAYESMNRNHFAPEDRTAPSTNPLKRSREDDDAEAILSGDEISPKQPSSQNITESDDGSVTPDYMDEDEDEDEEEDDEISAERKVQEYLAQQAAELARAKETVERARADGEWSPEEIFLLERIQYMGHEGLLPNWAKGWNFRTVPDAMWCEDDNALLGESSKCKYLYTFKLFRTNRSSSCSNVRVPQQISWPPCTR